MMDYEQKYKEALEWMKSLYNGLHGATKEEAEKYFPELKESEDEKIRKGIIELVKQSSEILSKSNQDRMLAWLEKQGEQKPADSYCQENCKGFKETGKCFADGDCKAKREAEHLEKQGKESSWKPTKEQYEALDYAYDSCSDTEYEGVLETLIKDLHRLEKRGEKKPAWSDEDEENLQHCCGAVFAADYYTYDDKQEMETWLESLKDRVQPRQKQEWSVEDSSKVQRICEYLDEAKKYYADITEVRECMDWLKSLKERLS